MFDKIFELVQEHLNNNPEVASKIPDDKKDAVANEVATHLSSGLTNHESLEGGAGGLLSMLENAGSPGNPLTNAIEGGLISCLSSKFGLSPAATGAIAGALPDLLQKFAHKVKDPKDSSMTVDDITKAASGKHGGMGSLFDKTNE